MPRKKETLTTTKGRAKDIEGVVVLENFHKGTIFNIEASKDKNLHRLILSPVHLFKQIGGTGFNAFQNEENAPYPLLAHLPILTTTLPTTTGYIVAYSNSSNTNDNRIFYSATSRGYVRAVKIDGEARDLGRPVSPALDRNDISLGVFAGNIYLVSPVDSGNVFYISETTTGTTWSTITATSPQFLVPFSVYLYFADKQNASDGYRRLIKVLTTSNAILGSLDLGVFWDVIDIQNNNNKFLVIIAQKQGQVATQTLFLWDGNYQTVPFHSLRLPGVYLGGVNYQGSFLLFLQVGNGVNVYELAGYSLRFIESFPGIFVPTILLPSQRFSVYGNYIVFPVAIKDQNINALMVFNVLEDEAFLIDAGTANNLLSAFFTSSLNGNIRLFFNDTTEKTIYSVNFIPNTSLDDWMATRANNDGELTPFRSGNYTIYWSNAINFLRRVRIDRADVYYSTKPANTGQKIQIDFFAYDKQANNLMNSSFVIDSSSQDYYSFTTDLGLIGDHLRFKISLQNDGNYGGFIKRLVIYFTYLD